MHVHFNMLGHVWAGVGEEYKLTGIGYTSIFFTVLLWSIVLVPFWITYTFRVYTSATTSYICTKLSTTKYNFYHLHLDNLQTIVTTPTVVSYL